jgi:hypothetical protein
LTPNQGDVGCQALRGRYCPVRILRVTTLTHDGGERAKTNLSLEVTARWIVPFRMPRASIFRSRLRILIPCGALTPEWTHHRGHDDAWNIAAVLWELLKKLRG